MFVCAALLVSVFSMSLSTSLVVREGQWVQMNCSQGVSEVGFSSYTWFKQPKQTPPVCILTISYYNKELPYLNKGKELSKETNIQYYNSFNETHVECSIDKRTNTSTLRIRSVSVSDSGLYYCGKGTKGRMEFYSVTNLTVAGNNLTFSLLLTLSLSPPFYSYSCNMYFTVFD